MTSHKAVPTLRRGVYGSPRGAWGLLWTFANIQNSALKCTRDCLVPFFFAIATLTGCDRINIAGETNAPIPSILVGVAKVDVTPAEAVHIINELEPFESEGVAQQLFAKAIAFGDDAGGGPAILISFDGIGVPAAVADEVAARLEKSRGIPRERIAVCATHTHWAPHLTGLLPTIFGGPLPPDHQARADAYTRQLVDSLESAALQALDDRQPARLSRAVGKVTFASNRRLEEDGRIVTDDALMFTWNPSGPVDHSLPLLCVRDLTGKLRALHFTYACHNVSITGREISRFRNRVHGDWAGMAQEKIEERFPGCLAMVTIGCGGDARPSPVGGLTIAEAQAREIAGEIDALLADSARWLPVSTGPIECRLERTGLPLEPAPDKETLQEYVDVAGKSRTFTARGHLAGELLARLERGETAPETVPFTAQSWSFGDDLAMVFLAGEVVVDYRNRIHEEFDGRRIQVIAYANATPCYIVSRRMLKTGGYEAGNSMYYYGWLSHLKPEAEDAVMNAVGSVLPPRFHESGVGSQPAVSVE